MPMMQRLVESQGWTVEWQWIKNQAFWDLQELQHYASKEVTECWVTSPRLQGELDPENPC